MRSAKNKKLIDVTLAAFLAVSTLTTFGLQRAHAATPLEVYVLFNRMLISTYTGGTVCMKPATTSTDVKTWSVTFPTGYTVSTTAADWQTSNIDTSTTTTWPGSPTPTAWPNATSATATVSGQTVTWTNTSAQSMNNTTVYCYNWTNSTSALRISSSATDSNLGTVATQDHLAATIDSGQYATSSVNADTISVNASVPVAFSFALANTTDNLPTLSTASVSSTQAPKPTVTVNTNAKNGWIVYAKDQYAGLHSATASYSIPAKTYSGAGPTTVTSNTEAYNTGVTSSQVGGNGTLTVDTGFASGGAGQGGGLTTTFHSIATSTGSADTAVLTLTNNAAIKASTPAATDYVDTITIVGAGLF